MLCTMRDAYLVAENGDIIRKLTQDPAEISTTLDGLGSSLPGTMVRGSGSLMLCKHADMFPGRFEAKMT